MTGNPNKQATRCRESCAQGQGNWFDDRPAQSEMCPVNCLAVIRPTEITKGNNFHGLDKRAQTDRRKIDYSEVDRNRREEGGVGSAGTNS